MPVLRLIALVLMVGLAGAAALAVGRLAAGEVERVLAARIAAALDAMGMGWASATVDGLTVDLRGAAPDREAQAAALSAVALVVPQAVTITERTTVQPPGQPLLPPPRVEMLRNGLRVTLTGRLADATAERALLDAFATEAPALSPESLIDLRAGRSGAPVALGLAVRAVAAVPQAHAVVEPGALRLSGLVATEEERARQIAALLAAAPEGVAIDFDLRVPPPVIAPFTVSLTRGPGGAIRLETCAARTAEEAAEIRARLIRAGLSDGAGACAVGLGGPPGDWPGAVVAGLDALAILAEGHLRVGQGLVRLTHAGADPMRVAEAEVALLAALPEDYVAELIALPEADAPTDPATASPGPAGAVAARPDIAQRPWLTASFDSDGVVLAGRIPDPAMTDALRALVAARFPGELLSDALRPLAQAAPVAGSPDWQAASLAAIEGLALLEAGRLELTDSRLELSGRIEDPELAGSIHRALAGSLPELAVTTELDVDLPAQVAAQPLTPERCLLRLNGHVALNPVRFDPGEAELEPGAERVLDTVADLLRRCPEARVEIGGHTDSQGSEGFNERLSAARANAVRDALLLRGIRLARLGVRGYGESRPIASNRSEAGRERNRRIAFAPLEEVGQ